MKTRISGFTLIEMVVIILIIAVLSIEVMPKLNMGAPLNVGSATAQMANDIRYTQALSMFSGQRYFLVADTSTSYSIKNASGTPIILANGTTAQNFPAGIVFGTPTGFSNMVGFTGRGVPIIDMSGTLLTSTGAVVITNGTQSSSITVAPTTGRVLIQ